MSDDIRQRYAEALAKRFTEPIYHDGRWVEKPDPSDRVGETLMVHRVVGGRHQFWGVSCMEAAEVCAAVRDEEIARLQTRHAANVDLIAELDDKRAQAYDDRDEHAHRADRAEAAKARVRETATSWHRDALKLSEEIPQRDRPEWVIVAHVCGLILAALDGEETDHG